MENSGNLWVVRDISTQLQLQFNIMTRPFVSQVNWPPSPDRHRHWLARLAGGQEGYRDASGASLAKITLARIIIVS